MFAKQKFLFLGILVAVLVGVGMLCVSPIVETYFSFLRVNEERQAKLTLLSAKLGGAESWDSIRFYLYCQIVVPGRVKADIERDTEQPEPDSC